MSCCRYANAEKCVNCGWNMTRMRNIKLGSVFFTYRVGELPLIEKQLLTSWLPSVEDLEHYPVCDDCVNLLNRLRESPGAERQVSHHEVCAACGTSIYRKLQRPISPKYASFFQQYLQPQLIGEKKICNACFNKASNVKKVINPNQETKLREGVEKGNTELHTSEEINTSNTELVRQLAIQKSETSKRTQLQLRQYSKVLEKRDECVACEEASIRRLNLPTRQQLLLRQKLYVSTSARVCETHRIAKNWPKIETPHCDFNGEEIADMTFLLKGIWPIDFGSIENLHRQILKRWIGMELVEFQQILQQNEVLSQRSDGKFALAVFLASRHTGECATVLASISQRPRGHVMAMLKLANECIKL